jgi:hypothetical protein
MTIKNTIDDRDLEALLAAIAGQVFVAGHAGYDQARQAWNLAVDQRPSVVVEAEWQDVIVRQQSTGWPGWPGARRASVWPATPWAAGSAFWPAVTGWPPRTAAATADRLPPAWPTRLSSAGSSTRPGSR